MTDRIKTEKVVVVAMSEDLGYTTYVFRNYDSIFSNEKTKYFMATLLPNWDQKKINLNDKGYVECKFVSAMKDKYYDTEKNEMIPFKYDNIYINKFIHITKDNSLIKL